MMKMKDLLKLLAAIIGIFMFMYATFWSLEKTAEVTYNTYDRKDFYATYEKAWEQVESDFSKARDVIYYDCLDDYYMNDDTDHFVVVRRFTVYYDTKHVYNYKYKLVMFDSDIVMSEYWEV